MKKLSSLERYKIIQPILENDVSSTEISKLTGIPSRTLRYWVKKFQEEGLAGLERKSRSDRGIYKSISPEMVELAIGLALQKPPLLITAIYRRISIIAKKKSLPPPSYDTVYGIIKKIDPTLITLAIEGSKAYQQKYELLYRMECKTSNEIWQADHTELDIFIIDENGNEKRPWLTTIIDDYSRAIAGIFLSFNSPSSINTALALRQAIWRKRNNMWEICGIPSILYTDHGTDFMSLHIQRVCVNLKTRNINSIVGRPQGRGKIERFFQTLNETVLIDLPGFSVKGKPSSKPLLNIEKLNEILEKFIIEIYHQSRHSSTGEAPIKRWAHGFLPRMPESIETLDNLLLSINKLRKIQRDGIRFMGFRYISTTLAGFVGELVDIRYDPRDLAEIKVYYNDAFLCKAICQDLSSLTISLKEIKKARQEIKRGLYKQIKDIKRVVSVNLNKNREVISKDTPVNNSSLRGSDKHLKLYEND